MNDYDPESEVITTLLARLGNEMEANRKLRAQVDELQANSTREVMARRQSLRSMVREFNATFGVEMPETPAFPDADTIVLRRNLILEETEELLRAIWDQDLVETADAIGDLLYVVEGTALAFGIDTGPVLAEIHASNLKKLGGGVDSNGKIQKPLGWTAPDILSVLMKQGMKHNEEDAA